MMFRLTLRFSLFVLLALIVAPGLARAACSNPAGVEGEVVYNQAYKVVQFCDDTNWIRMGGSSQDGRIGTLNNSKWCATNASGIIQCDQNAPATTAAGAANEVQFRNTSTGAFAADSVFVFDAVNKRLGIGTGSPGYKLHVVSTGVGVIGNSSNDWGGFSADTYSDTASPSMAFNRGRGTATAITAVQNGDWLGYVNFAGYDSPTTTQNTAMIRGVVTAAASAGVVPTALVFDTSATNTAGRTERMRIGSNGYVGIATAGDALAPLEVKAAAGGGVNSGIRMSNTTNTNFGQVTADTNGFVRIGGNAGVGIGTNNSSAFTEVMRVTSNGLVIGGTGLDTNAVLDLQSTTKGFVLPRMTTAQAGTLDTATSTNGMLIFDTDTGTVKVQTGGAFISLAAAGGGLTGAGSAGHVSYWSSASGLTYDSDGNFFWDATNNRLGIGTVTPSYALSVNGVIQGQTGGSGDVLMVGNDGKISDINVANTVGIQGIQDSTVASIKLGSAGPVISGQSGNFGVGTTTPATKFEMAGTVGNFQLTSDGAHLRMTRGAVNYIQAVTAGGELYFNVNGNADGSPTLALKADGKTGIGVATPVSTLDINGGVRIGTEACASGKAGMLAYNSGVLQICDGTNFANVAGAAGGTSTSNVGYLQLGAASGAFTDSGTTSGNQLFFDNANKRLGIGTATPDSQLTVMGETRLSGNGTSAVQFGDSGATNQKMRILADAGSVSYIQAGNANTDTDADLRISRFYTTNTNINDFDIYADETSFSGLVGVGTTSPLYKLDVRETRTDVSGALPSSYVVQTVAPSGASTANNIASWSRLDFTGATNGGTDLRGSYGLVSDQGAALVAQGIGAHGVSRIDAASARMTLAYGAFGSAQNASRTSGIAMDNAIGTGGAVSNSNTGTITNATGTYSLIENTTTGSITTGYGFSAAVNNAGSIGTYYGLYLPAFNGTSPTNHYGVYVAQPSYNYFAGNVGMGTASPAHALDVRRTSGTDVGVNIMSYRAGSAFGNSYITFGAPRSDTNDGNTTNNRAYIVSLGDSTQVPSTLFIGANTANGVVTGDAAAIRANQNLMELSSSGTVDFWRAGTNYARISGAAATPSYINASSFGLGTATPQSLLQVANTGYAQFSKTFTGAPTAADCDAAAEIGRVTFDTTNNRFYFCNGTAWVYDAMGASGGGGSSSTSNAGYVQLGAAGGAFTDSGTTANQQFFWDNTNKRLGVGTATPAARLQINANMLDGSQGILLYNNTTTSAAPVLEARGRRSDGNGSQGFGGGVALSTLTTGAATPNNVRLGTMYFGGNHTDGTEANLLYTSSISGIAEGAFSNSTTMPTGLVFFTGSTGRTLGTVNADFGTERMRITSAGRVGIGTTTPAAPLEVSSTSTVANSAEEFGIFLGKTYGIADGGLKQGLRVSMAATHTTGTLGSLNGVLVVNSNSGGGTISDSTAYWARVDSSAGSTVNNTYGMMINNAAGTGTIGTQYGVYVGSLTRGANNYAIYTAGSTPSSFGGQVSSGSAYLSTGTLAANQTSTMVTDYHSSYGGRLLAFGPSGTVAPISFWTGSGGAAAVERMRIDPTGSVSIGNQGNAAVSAIFDVTSTSKGFLPPRMTTTQRDAIASTTAGLMIFNTTTSQLETYSGSAWVANTVSGAGSATVNTGYVQLAGASGAFTDSGTTAGNQFFWDNTNKRLGIGTAAPSAPLQVGSGTYAADAEIRLGSGNGSQQRLWSIRVPYGNASTTAPNYDLVFRDVTGGFDRMVIDYGTGNVGIGTNSPSAPLTIAGSTATATAGEDAAALFGRTYGIADTQLKQGIRVNVAGSHTTGTLGNLSSFVSYLQQTGSGGTVTHGYGYYSGGAISTGATMTNMSHVRIADVTGAGTIGTQYGLYIDTLAKGGTNYAVYTNGSTPSYFGGNVGIGATPTAADRLYVYGDLLASTTATTSGSARHSGVRVWVDRAFGMELHYGQTGHSTSWATALYGRSSDTVALRLGAYPGNSTAQTDFIERATLYSNGNFGINTLAPRNKLHVTQSASNGYALFQSSGGGGGTALTGTDIIPIVSSNGFIGYNGIGVIPSKWGNASGPVDDHNVVYIAGSQRNVNAQAAGIAFANWAYFSGTGTGAGGLGNAAAQTDAVKFEVGLTDGGSEFSQALRWRSRSASGVSTEVMTMLSNGNIGIGLGSNGTPSSLLQVGATGRSAGISGGVTAGVLTLRYDDNGNSQNLILQNLSSTAAADHGNSMLWQFGTDSAATPINAGRILVGKAQNWTSTGTTQDAYMQFNVANDGVLASPMTVYPGGVNIGTLGQNNKLAVATSAVNDGIVLFGNSTTVSLLANLGSGAYNGMSVSGDRGLIFGGTAVGSPGGGFVIAPWMSGTAGLRVSPAGLVGISTTTPQAALDVNGGARVGADATCTAAKSGMLAYNSGVLQLCTTAGTFVTVGSSGGAGATTNSGTTINWSSTDVQSTSASCAAMSFSGMVDGGTYSLTVEGTTTGTCSFTHSGLVFKLPPNHGATTSGKMTLYQFIRRGTNVFVTWQPGY